MNTIARMWDDYNSDDEGDKDDHTYDPPAPIEEAGTSNVGSSHFFDSQVNDKGDKVFKYRNLYAARDNV